MKKKAPTKPRNILLIWSLVFLSLQGCAAIGLRGTPQSPVIASDDDFVVVMAQPGDTARKLAKRFLGDESRDWEITEVNEAGGIQPGRSVVIPLTPVNPAGVYTSGYQTVPILCYHRFGNGHVKLSVSAKNFDAQMEYLKSNGYRVVPLKDVVDFISGRKALPRKSVVITIDDGYRSTFAKAFPILKRYGFPATVFLYTDFVGGGDALTWTQMKTMVNSGLIDIQPHSQKHSNMGLQLLDESDDDYHSRIEAEITVPSATIKSHLKEPLHTFAYPYGDSNQDVIDNVKAHRFILGVTVEPGTNPSFTFPYMLRRNMIFGDDTLDDFKAALDTFEKATLK